jgi:LCP family protein required for cell wall assembly
MNFKKRRIRNQLRKIRQIESPAEHPNSPTEILRHSESKARNPQYVNLITIAAGLILIFGLFWITVSIIKSLDLGSVVFSFGKELKKDTHKQTNFLLVGVGGEGHDGSNLTDTIILASLSEKDKTVKMLSLPRDLYIDDKVTGGQRVNKIYDTYFNKYDSSSKAMEKLAETVTTLTGIPVHYTIKVNFDGFVKIVDALGGVTVNVEKSINDPFYPKGETIKYETFTIQAGIQELDGETALKYARSRKTTSDFDRAKRQQQLLSAIKEKALSLNILTDPGKIQTLYGSVADSLETNLTVAEIIELAKISKDINKDQLQSRVLSDDFTSCGGLLYTPVRDYFAGAAVLLPAGNNSEEITRFSEDYFYKPADSTTEIQVLNGTKTSGLAYDYLNRLSRDCLNVVHYGNASNRELAKSTIYYLPETAPDGKKTIPAALSIIQEIIDAPLTEGIPGEYLLDEKTANTTIVIELGADYKKITTEDPFNKLLYMTPLAPEETTAVETGAEKPLNSPKSDSASTSAAATTSAASGTDSSKKVIPVPAPVVTTTPNQP